MPDILNMKYINSLPQPFVADLGLWGKYEINDIEVGTGLMRINVCGLLEVKFIVDAVKIVDMDGIEHDPETFYADYEPEIGVEMK